MIQGILDQRLQGHIQNRILLQLLRHLQLELQDVMAAHLLDDQIALHMGKLGADLYPVAPVVEAKPEERG
ncbi:hypothetical protein D3C73_1499590 [compost metagenome]